MLYVVHLLIGEARARLTVPLLALVTLDKVSSMHFLAKFTNILVLPFTVVFNRLIGGFSQLYALLAGAFAAYPVAFLLFFDWIEFL